MQAYHDDAGLKADLLARVTARNAAACDKPKWANANYVNFADKASSTSEADLGIPALLARIQERIFIRMSNDRARTFPQRFVAAIPVGADLTLATRRFLHEIASDFVAQTADEATRRRYEPALAISARWARGEAVASGEMRDALGTQRQPSEREIARDPTGHACESVVRLTDPHLVNPLHGADVMMSTISHHVGMIGGADRRDAVFDAFADRLVATLETA